MKKSFLPSSEDYRLVLSPDGHIRIYSCRTLECVYRVMFEKGDNIVDNMLIGLLAWEQRNREGTFIPKNANTK